MTCLHLLAAASAKLRSAPAAQENDVHLTPALRGGTVVVARLALGWELPRTIRALTSDGALAARLQPWHTMAHHQINNLSLVLRCVALLPGLLLACGEGEDVSLGDDNERIAAVPVDLLGDYLGERELEYTTIYAEINDITLDAAATQRTLIDMAGELQAGLAELEPELFAGLWIERKLYAQTRSRREHAARSPAQRVAAALVLSVGHPENSPTPFCKLCRKGASRGVLGLIGSRVFQTRAQSHDTNQQCAHFTPVRALRPGSCYLGAAQK